MYERDIVVVVRSAPLTVGSGAIWPRQHVCGTLNIEADLTIDAGALFESK